MDRLRPRSPAGWTIAVFGALAVASGLFGLLRPQLLLDSLGFPTPSEGAATVFVAASSMAALNMGVYYLVAAATEWRPFFLFTVPFRLLTCVVFTLLVVVGPAPTQFLGVALWEGAGAVATGLALAYQAQRAGVAATARSGAGQ